MKVFVTLTFVDFCLAHSINRLKGANWVFRINSAHKIISSTLKQLKVHFFEADFFTDQWLETRKSIYCNFFHILRYNCFLHVESHPFYSSPHLIHVRERIRISGDPLSEKNFVKYFEHIYSSLEKAVKVFMHSTLSTFRFQHLFSGF